LKTSTTAMVAGAVTGQLGALRGAHAAGSDVLKVGLVGCGGRGSGAAAQVLQADPHTELVAMGDVFQDALEKSHTNLKNSAVGDRVKVAADRRFVGFDAYQKVIDSVDVVLLGEPPHFRPKHLRAAVEAGKHVFAEKPVAVDAPGVHSVLESARMAKEKNLSLVSGLCWRYETGMIETMRRLHDGQVGEIRALETTRYSGGVGKRAPRRPEWTDMEYQMRNWYYFTWLSGDFIAEQFVHELDKMAWVMNDEPPVSCMGMGGRQTRIAPEYGHIYDHFYVIYEYANGTKLYAATRHQPGCSNAGLDLVHGTVGRFELMKYAATGKQPWKWDGRRTNMHQLEQDAFMSFIRSGNPRNDGEYMAKSTMMAIMGRMSAYTGKTLTWEQALNSTENLSPPKYDWDVPLPDPPVAMPGFTPFV
jgi:predicted dehydrogenase